MNNCEHKFIPFKIAEGLYTKNDEQIAYVLCEKCGQVFERAATR